jgi:hypothetical protein
MPRKQTFVLAATEPKDSLSALARGIETAVEKTAPIASDEILENQIQQISYSVFGSKEWEISWPSNFNMRLKSGGASAK